MFGMKGFCVSASGAIQGHHGPLVFKNKTTVIMIYECQYGNMYENYDDFQSTASCDRLN